MDEASEHEEEKRKEQCFGEKVEEDMKTGNESKEIEKRMEQKKSFDLSGWKKLD